MESSQESSFTDSFNPFLTGSNQTGVGATSLIYEPLLQFNIAEPLSAPYHWLATGYTWGASGKSITFTIRSGVDWSNGTALTPADVAFTYNMLKQYPDANTSGLPITGASASGNNVTVNFSSSQYANLQYVASVYIVPQSIWSAVGDPGQYLDPTPIASGPYTLANFTPQGFTLKANASYWGGAPKVGEVDFPTISSSATALAELDTNQLDWAGNFITGLQKAFEGSSSSHQVWFKGVNTVTLYPNLAKFPTNELAVRQAISLAINRTVISSQGESGFEPPATNASGLVLPNFQGLLTLPKATSALNQTPNVKAAKSTLEAAGWAMGRDGYFHNSAGKVLSMVIPEPASYSDYAADATLIAKELRAAGMQATFDGTSVSAWGTDVGDGDFNITLHWGFSGISAYQLYNYWLNSAQVTGSNAKAATGDYERLVSPAMDAALAKLGGAVTVAQQKKALVPIESYVATQLPVIPTTYGAAFDEYNTAAFTGWPSASNEYESGSPNTPTNEVIVLHLRPTS
jgi:peptide/nickel transport system substrate-binding protein